MLTEEVLLLGGGEPGVAVGRPDHAEFVGVDAQFAPRVGARSAGRAGVLVLQHLVLLQHAEVEVALVPGLVVGELVVWGEEYGWASPSPLIWVAS